MDPNKAHALRVCGPMIVQSLDAEAILDHLFSKGWISHNEIELIGLEKTTQNKSRKILELIRSRPSGAFDDFLLALDLEGSFLSSEIRKHITPSPFRKKERSVSDLRELLLEGAVPDKPTRYINRPDLVNILSNKLRALSDHFRVDKLPANKLAEMDITPRFQDYSEVMGNLNPPPTNAWLLIHGSPGSGKSVLSASVLRQESALLVDCFPGGVIWMHVGPLFPNTLNSDAVSYSNQSIIQLIDRLEYRVSQLGEHVHGENANNHLSASHRLPTNSSSSLDDSLERLRRSLIRKQQRTSWGPDENGNLITSLLLIVLDDVWDVEVGRVLSGLPGAFLVTSRDLDILERVETPVDKLHLYNDLSEGEIANLLSMWTGYSAEEFIPSCKSSQNLKDSDISLSAISQLTYGLPFAVSLLGSLLYNQFHRLSDYIIDIHKTGCKSLNWVAIKRPSAYGYDSVFQAFNSSLSLLSLENQAYYRRLVIFDPGIVLTPKMCAILWALPEDKSETILSTYTRYSLATRHWIYKVGNCGYTIHGIQLDLLKSYIDPIEQANYHAKFIQNYYTFCGGRWLKLVSSWEHIYFWNHATEHLFKAAQLDQLVDLLINLDFLRGRLKVIGTTPVIADFQRYRAVFVTLNRMSEWLAYLRFIQTNAYYVIDPTIVQDCERSRSPCQGSRRSSVANLDLSPPNFRPDSRCISPFDSRRNLFSKNSRSNSINVPDRSGCNTSPKGVDLLQLGLGLSQDNPVFQHAFQLLTQRHQAVLKMHPSSKEEVSKTLSLIRAFKYYWFWCNSHIAASQLLWAIPTGSQAITCLAIEQPYDISSLFASSSTEDLTDAVKTDNGEDLAIGSFYLHPNNRYRKRYLASTNDGRVLLLDANSGYEVALHQVYSPDIEVKFLSFLSKNTECLTCGSDGSLVISTLPVAEEIPCDEFYPYDGTIIDHEDDTLPLEHYMNNRISCDLDAIDDDLSIHALMIDSNQSSRYSTSENINICVESDESETYKAEIVRRQRRSTIVSPVYGSTPIDVPTPIVLADLPRLTELARVDNTKTSSYSITSEPNKISSDSGYQLHCMAANSSVDLLIMIGEGCLNSVSHHMDGLESTAHSKTALKLPNVYHLKRGSGGQIRLDCSRELSLPYLPSDHWYPQLCTESNSKVHLASVSEDGNIIAICLSDGFIWFYNLDIICWISCISTKLSMDCVTKFLAQRFAINIFDECEHSELFETNTLHVGVGPAASCAIFLPPFVNDGNPTSIDNAPIFFAASLSTQVLIWCLPNTDYQFCESKILENEILCRNSFPRLHLSCSCASTVLSMDARIIEGQCILAGGTASGRVLIWRVRDGCKLVELSVHASWVTALRLLPDDFKQFSCEDYFSISKSCLPIGLLTASVDGVIKRWDVGATCLPTPTTPTPTGSVWPHPFSSGLSSHRHSNSSNTQNSIAVHGLWTHVFSVWFGEHGSLLVVGRRRHSADLQFLFRPTQLNYNNETSCSFQEITIRPSQSSYWNPQAQHKVIEVNPCESNGSIPSAFKNIHKSSVDSNHQSSLPIENSKKVLPFKHWILTTGLSSPMYGAATSVSFWKGGNWVAVGFNTGNVIVYSLHFDDSQLYGIVRRYYLLACCQNLSDETSASEKRNFSSYSTLQDHILHLHTWIHCSDSSDLKDSKLLVVVGVFESGCIKVWYLSDVCHKLSNPTTPCINVYPAEYFPKLHSDAELLTSSSVSDQKTKLNVQTSDVNDSSPNGNNAVITWSSCRLIERFQHPLVCDNRTRSSQRRSSLDKKGSKMLVWITTGRDGRVFGRELFLPSDNRLVIVNGESDHDFESKRWRLDLDAHVPMTITDADIGPSGHWLITGSTDKTAKVWLLPSGTLAFDTGTHPMCVRSVAFQPLIDVDEEIIMVTGDDEGTLRVWRLTTQMLCSQIGSCHNTVSNEKNVYLRRPTVADLYHYDVSRSQKPIIRIPSPDPTQRFISRSGYSKDANRLFNKRPDYYSTAAGYGSTWLHKLTWSPDGRLLAGLSDRLCVWPFESTQQFDSNDDSNGSSDNNATSPILSVRRVSVPDKVATLNPPKFEIQQCRVLTVLSSGACNLTGTPPLIVSSSRLLEINRGDKKDYGPFSSIDLPPTIVTVDQNTGTLYIFDPIGSLF
ncbi:hypothetical protein MN116_003764 [Schistosoma mekongi]|uniref:CARD domain-containing protein n=1 Tax=Schistosoma mekongi TaxID=38744 RepID=A0AAE1ZFF8_SCHME|nr:hypothetical protein MN116_003764 [Schistosoma mekongi]